MSDKQYYIHHKWIKTPHAWLKNYGTNERCEICGITYFNFCATMMEGWRSCLTQEEKLIKDIIE